MSAFPSSDAHIPLKAENAISFWICLAMNRILICSPEFTEMFHTEEKIAKSIFSRVTEKCVITGLYVTPFVHTVFNVKV